jgi:hypothetical protein
MNMRENALRERWECAMIDPGKWRKLGTLRAMGVAEVTANI